MEQTNASEEIIIQEIAMEVESEFQLGGLSDGLYFTFAAEVAKRYALLAVSKERERIVEIIDKSQGYECVLPEIDPSLGELTSGDIDFVKSKYGQIVFKKELINLINTK